MNAARSSVRSDPGFVDVFSPDLARRQLRVSVGLVGALAVAIGVTLGTVGAPRLDVGDAKVAQLTVQQPTFVRSATASVQLAR